MHKSKVVGWLLGGLVLALMALSLVPGSATASPLYGFTDTAMPSPTSPPATPRPPRPPSKPEVVDPLITKRADVERIQVGDLVQFTLEVTNPNSVDIYNVIITDVLPEIVDLISTSTPQGSYTYDDGTRTLTYDLGTLTAGQVLQITIVVRANSRAQAPDQISNSATLRWDDGRSVTSNTVVVSIIPSSLPKTGEGPGWGEMGVMAGALLAGLGGLGLAGLWGLRLIRRA